MATRSTGSSKPARSKSKKRKSKHPSNARATDLPPASMSDSMNTVTQQLPQALAELRKTHQTMTQIAAHCRDGRKKDDYDAIYKKTQDYTKDTLMNVAYHVHTVGTHLNNFLQLQARELEKLELEMQTFSDHLRALHDYSGAKGFEQVDYVRGYVEGRKVIQLDDQQMPESSKPGQPFIRQRVSLQNLDTMNLHYAWDPAKVALAPIPSGTKIPSKRERRKTHKSSTGSRTPRRKSISQSQPPPPPTSSAPAPPPIATNNLPPPPDVDVLPPPPMEVAPPPPMGMAPPPPPVGGDLPPPPDSDAPPPPPPVGSAPPPPPPL